jgi:capsular polysaccharide biosynthesis protein
MENPQDSKLHFLDYWRVIRVRLGLVILVFLLVVIAAGVATYLLPRKYNSFVTIEVEPEMTPVRIFENQTAAQQPINDPKFTQTQFQIITRKGVLYPVIDRLNLQRKWGSNGEPLPKEIADKRLLGMLSLQEVRNTNLIQIDVYSTDPQEAALLANTIADVYMEQRISEQQSLVAKGLDQMVIDYRLQPGDELGQEWPADPGGGRGHASTVSASALRSREPSRTRKLPERGGDLGRGHSSNLGKQSMPDAGGLGGNRRSQSASFRNHGTPGRSGKRAFRCCYLRLSSDTGSQRCLDCCQPG